MRPASETLADPDYEITYMPDGTIQARRKAGMFTKALPYVIGAGMAAPHLMALAGVGSAAGSGSAATTGGTVATGGVPNWLGPAGLPGGAAYDAAASAPGGGGGLWDAIWNGVKKFGGKAGDKAGDMLSDPQNLAGIAALLPMLMMALKDGGNQQDFGQSGVNDEISKAMAMQRGRVEQTQPVFDTLVNMSYGATPTRYRGNAPANYPAKAQDAPAGPYRYEGPRFR